MSIMRQILVVVYFANELFGDFNNFFEKIEYN